MKIKEIMKKHVVTSEPGITMAALSKIMTNNRVGSVVIMDKGKPVDILTTNDIVTTVSQGKDPKKVTARNFLRGKRRPFLFVTPNDNVMETAKKMAKTGRKRMPVIENGKLVGIVSTKEILLVSPEIMEIMSERLKAKADAVARPNETIEGLCESCDQYSDRLRNVDGRWVCSECRD